MNNDKRGTPCTTWAVSENAWDNDDSRIIEPIFDSSRSGFISSLAWTRLAAETGIATTVNPVERVVVRTKGLALK
jgi:hypothetical protein